MTLTRSLGQFVADLSPNRLPKEAARATGRPSRPLTDRQIFEKFTDCLDAGDSPIPADVLFKRLSAIQSVNARDLTAGA